MLKRWWYYESWKADAPLHILPELGSWESIEMVRWYAHRSMDHLAEYADRLSSLRVVESVDTNLAQA